MSAYGISSPTHISVIPFSEAPCHQSFLSSRCGLAKLYTGNINPDSAINHSKMGSARVAAEATAKYTAKNSAKRKKIYANAQNIRYRAWQKKNVVTQKLRSTRKKAANKNDKADPFPKYGTFTTTKTTWTMARRKPYE
ncbi:uncharacterized protein RCO7_14911 [Rhynchosporium graminicola]|uniref:Uncharacterized protein n=1 Tax=Rhynchosporium graminicola TaxID=2792576 RepID=A0A1E1LA07_9HELO|nr:uncharacterized protein RCO7_14911 [Rhynchosporium commune]